MISTVIPSGRYVQVSDGTASTYVNGYPGAQGVGNMRYNTANQRMEVFDGANWQMLNMSSVSVGLSGEAETLLDWARQKRDEELMWKSLATENEAVKIALENLEKAKSQLTVTAQLAREYEKTS